MGDASIRLGTRGSRLALWQAHHVAERLRAAWPDLQVTIVSIQTTGDRVADVPLPRIGERGLFTQDIEDGLRERIIDAAVHSLKDLPTSAAPGVTVGAVVARDDPREALVTGSGLPLERLAQGARVGTSSLRRRAQLLSLRPDLGVTDIRGNVPTRIAKVTSGEYDAVLLAHAGLIRLGLTAQVAQIFDDDVVVPAPGQGALAVQARADDDGVLSRLSAIDDGPTRLATLSERAVLAALRGGCQAPLGALAKWHSPAHLRLSAIVAAVDRPSVLRATDHGVVETEAQAIALGEAVADALCKLGAGAVLKAARDWVAAADAGDAA